jgi:hypothetical protein
MHCHLVTPLDNAALFSTRYFLRGCLNIQALKQTRLLSFELNNGFAHCLTTCLKRLRQPLASMSSFQPMSDAGGVSQNVTEERGGHLESERPKLTYGSPVTYRICIQGCLDQKRSDFLQGMAISTGCDENRHPIITLTGQILDRAALFTVLSTRYDYRLPLLSVECLTIGPVTQKQ